MIKNIRKSLVLCTVVARQIKTDDLQKLEIVKDRLKARMGSPVGLHTAGAPLIFSAIFSLLSFTMPQLSLWLVIFHWLHLSEDAVFTGIISAGLVYCLLLFPTLTFFSRGYLQAFKFYLLLISLTAALAIVYFLYVIIPCLSGAESKSGFLIGSILGVVFITASIKCLNSPMFFKTTAFCLHNRVWRKQIKIQATVKKKQRP